MPKQALPGKRINSFIQNPFEVLITGIDIAAGPTNPLWDPRILMPLDQNIIDTMCEIGVRDPVEVKKIVYPKGTEIIGPASEVYGSVLKQDSEIPTMIDGHRRGLHARAATLKMRKQTGDKKFAVALTAKTPEKGDVNSMLVIKRVKNSHREESTPIIKAYEAKQLLDVLKDHEATARYMRVTVPHLKEILKLIDTSPALYKALLEGKLPASSGTQLASLPKTRQDEVTKIVLDSGNTAPAAVRGIVRGVKKKIKQDEKERAEKRTGRPKNPLQLAKSDVLEGVPPEKRFVRKIVEDIKEMRAADDQMNKTTAMELDIVRWTVEWLYDGAPPPPCTVVSGLVKKHGEKKANKAEMVTA